MNCQNSIFQVPKNKPEHIHPETFCIDDLMDEMLIFVKKELQKRGKSKVKSEILKYSNIEKCWVHTDRKLLRDVFFHLLDISVKLTDRGCICFGYHTGVSNIINFLIEDTGTGIYNDSGYELSIAQGLVEQLGGNMEVEFVEDVGMSVDFNMISQPCEIFEN